MMFSLEAALSDDSIDELANGFNGKSGKLTFERCLARMKQEGATTRDIDAVRAAVKDRAKELKAEAVEAEAVQSGKQAPPKDKDTWAAHLISIAERGTKLWRDENSDAWLTVGGRQSFRVGSTEHENYLVRCWNEQSYHSRDDAGRFSDDPVLIGQADINKAVKTLEVRAQSAPQYYTYLRTAPLGDNNGAFAIDLGDHSVGMGAGSIRPELIIVSNAGWHLDFSSSYQHIKFRRGVGMTPMIVPAALDGCGEATLKRLEEFRHWLQLDQERFCHYVTWLTYSAQPQRSYVVLVFVGTQGSMKTTRASVARKLLDPTIAEMDDPPKDIRNYAVACDHAHIVAVDNVSGLSLDIQDLIARTATGAGFRHRTLYTDRELTVFRYVRPQIIGGIGDSVTRPDVLERSLVLRLDRPAQYRSDAEAWREFEEKAPYWLGALLDVVVYGLQRLVDVPVPGDVRMAAFGQWGMAVAPVLGYSAEEWLSLYRSNQAQAIQISLDSSVMGGLLLKMLAAQQPNENGCRIVVHSPEDFVTALHHFAIINDLGAVDRTKLPQTSSKLREVLERLKPSLEGVGVVVDLDAWTGAANARRRAYKLTDCRSDVDNSVPELWMGGDIK